MRNCDRLQPVKIGQVFLLSLFFLYSMGQDLLWSCCIGGDTCISGPNGPDRVRLVIAYLWTPLLTARAHVLSLPAAARAQAGRRSSTVKCEECEASFWTRTVYGTCLIFSTYINIYRWSYQSQIRKIRTTYLGKNSKSGFINFIRKVNIDFAYRVSSMGALEKSHILSEPSRSEIVNVILWNNRTVSYADVWCF